MTLRSVFFLPGNFLAALMLFVTLCAGCATPAEWTSNSVSSEAASAVSSAEEHRIFAPRIVESRQLTGNWCWAACFETVLCSSGVPTTQAIIVRLVKGAVVNATISIDDILRGFNGRGMTVRYVIGKPTRDELTFFLASSDSTTRHFIVEKRNVGTYDWHAVVVWGFEIPEDGRLLVYMYDPLANRENKVWHVYDNNWLGTFYVTVNVADATKYWSVPAIGRTTSLLHGAPLANSSRSGRTDGPLVAR